MHIFGLCQNILNIFWHHSAFCHVLSICQTISLSIDLANVIYVMNLMTTLTPNQFFMPLPLGAVGTMFSGCPSVHPSVRPKPEIPSVHMHMGSLVHPTNHDRFSACPSVRRGFREFPEKRMKGMAWNFASWCILTTFRGDYIRVMVCWFSFFWRHFCLVNRVKFGVSGHLQKNAWREWLEMLHADVSELTRLWSSLVDF